MGRLGAYYLFIGTSVSETEMAACLTLDDTVFVRKLTNICPLLSSLTEIEPSDELVSAWEAECAESSRAKAISIDNAIHKLQTADEEGTKKNAIRDAADRLDIVNSGDFVA